MNMSSQKAQFAKCLTSQFHTTKHLNKSPGHEETAYQERGAGPGHGGQRPQIGCLAQHIELFLSDGQDLVSEGSLPGVQFQNLDPIQDFIHQLDASVLVLHLLHLRERTWVSRQEEKLFISCKLLHQNKKE